VPPPPPQTPAYAGQVPAQPTSGTAKKKRKPILIGIIVAALLLLCVCVAVLIYIDVNAAWCDWFGWAFNMVSPGLCP
jgi:uncharacterized integral membrane protein